MALDNTGSAKPLAHASLKKTLHPPSLSGIADVSRLRWVPEAKKRL